MEEFDNLVPSTTDFQVGYFSGKQSKKHWLIEDGDLKEMYDMASVKKNVFLWCDSKHVDKSKELKRKKSSNDSCTKSKRIELEEDMDDIIERIREIHGDKFSYSQYRIWARLVKSGLYKDITTVPPDPALQGIPQPPKRIRNELLSDVIAGAAVTFVNAMRSPEYNASVKVQNSVVINSSSPPKEHIPTLGAGISPCRAAEL